MIKVARADIIHFTGVHLLPILKWFDRHRIDWVDLSNRVYDWMEKNHACCTKHGYRKD